jgi:hypothetical protein
VLFAFSLALFGQITAVKQGSEFSILGAIPGDQVSPSLSLTPTGGALTWQDNSIDKHGAGVAGCLLDTSFNAGHSFRVDKVFNGRHFKPKVQLLANNQVLYVWQGSVTANGIPSIYARFATNTAKGATTYGTNFTTADVRVNTYVRDQQVDPAVTALTDGSAVVAWSSYGEDGSMWGIYARRLGAKGKIMREEVGLKKNGTALESTKEFLVNQFTTGNQRNPAVATLGNGDFVVAWVSEQERAAGSADIYARIFTPDGVPVTDEIPVDTGNNICSAPSLAPSVDGGFTAVWAEQDAVVATNGLDIWGRTFSSSGSPEVNDFLINTHQFGDQFAPKIATCSAGSLVVWTSLGQDGSREGVFGRFIAGGLQVSGPEFQVNTTFVSQQMHPAVAWNGDHFLVVWTSFEGASGFDLYGQQYVVPSP